MKRKIDLEDIGFAISSSGVVIYKKDGTHVTLCVKRNKLEAHVTNERTGKRESLFVIPLNSVIEWAGEHSYQFFLQLLNRCLVTDNWIKNSRLLFQSFLGENGLLEFFEERQGAYRLKSDINFRLIQPEELEDQKAYLAYTEDFVFKGILIISKPRIFFIPADEINAMIDYYVQNILK